MAAASEWYRRVDNNDWRPITGADLRITARGTDGKQRWVLRSQLEQEGAVAAAAAAAAAAATAAGVPAAASRSRWGPGPVQSAAAAKVAGPHLDKPAYHPDQLVRHVDAVRKRKQYAARLR